TNGASLIGDGASDRLSDPPGRIGGKLITAAPLKLVNRFHQADIAFLYQIQKLQTAIRILLGDRDHQTQIRLNQFALCLTGLLFAGRNRLQRALDFNWTDIVLGFNSLQSLLRGQDASLVLLLIVGLDTLAVELFGEIIDLALR